MVRIAGYELDRLLGMVFTTVIGRRDFRVIGFRPGPDGGTLHLVDMEVSGGRGRLTVNEFARGMMLRAFVEV